MYFKPMVGHSYVHKQRCHHPMWKWNIPYSQFCRLLRNCTRQEDYCHQSQVLVEKYSQKGNSTEPIKLAYERYLNKYTSYPLASNDGQRGETVTFEGPIFTSRFNSNYRFIQKIINNYCSILQCDLTLATRNPQCPHVVFRKAKNIKNIVDPSKISTLRSAPSCYLPTFFYPCGDNFMTVDGPRYSSWGTCLIIHDLLSQEVICYPASDADFLTALLLKPSS